MRPCVSDYEAELENAIEDAREELERRQREILELEALAREQETEIARLRALIDAWIDLVNPTGSEWTGA